MSQAGHAGLYLDQEAEASESEDGEGNEDFVCEHGVDHSEAECAECAEFLDDNVRESGIEGYGDLLREYDDADERQLARFLSSGGNRSPETKLESQLSPIEEEVEVKGTDVEGGAGLTPPPLTSVACPVAEAKGMDVEGGAGLSPPPLTSMACPPPRHQPKTKATFNETKDYIMNVRTYGITVFTTATLEEVCTAASKMSPEVDYLLVAEEAAPSTGNRHLHLTVVHRRRPCFRKCPWLPIFNNKPSFHKLYDVAHWIDYCKKEMKYEERGERPEPTLPSLNHLLQRAKKETKTQDEFIHLIDDERPAFVAVSLKRLQEYWAFIKPPEPARVSKWKAQDYEIPRLVKQWMDQEYKKSDRPRCLVLFGPTKTGKTEMMRALLPNAVYMRTNLSVETYLNKPKEADAVIYDDVSWYKFGEHAKAWLCAMGDNIMTDKYLKKVHLDMRLPAVYIINNDMFNIIKNDHEFDNYWLHNMIVCEVSTALYKPVAAGQQMIDVSSSSVSSVNHPAAKRVRHDPEELQFLQNNMVDYGEEFLPQGSSLFGHYC